MKRTSMRVWKLVTASAMMMSLFTSTTSFTNAQSTADEIMGEMTLRQKIGQMIMPDFRQWIVDGKTQNVTVMNEEIRKIIRDYDFGGVILFANNVTKTEQTTRLTYDLQHTAIEDDNLPLLITIDQEGGNVVRLGTGTSLPGNMALGATRDPEAAYDAGDIIGSELHALGINVNFAPVVDINSNPSNPVIGERSIGSDPKLVADIAVPLIKGMQANNTATAVKHFPGHGDTATDSHVGLPLVDKTYEELKDFELVPFQAAADAGTDMIMTAHIQVPKIETETAISKKDGKEINIPATLSKALITGVIREKMNYDGIVVTDALNMSAISDNFGETDAVLRTFKADVDIALMPTILRKPSDVQKLEAIYQTVENAVNSGELSMDNIDNSVKRIIDLKIKRGIIDIDNYNTSVEEDVENAKKVVGSAEHHATERLISQKAITVVKNDDHLLPMKPKAGEKILMIGAYSNEPPALQYGLTKLMAEGVVDPEVQYDSTYYTSSMKDLTSLQKKLDWADRIIAITEISNASHLKMTSWLSNIPTQLCAYAKEADKPIVLISIAKPYDAVAFPDTQAMVLAYASKGMDPTEPGQEPTNTYGPNIPAAMDIIFGKVPATGKLPVDVYALNEDRTYSDTIQLPFGYGLKTSENESFLKEMLGNTIDKASNVTSEELDKLAPVVKTAFMKALGEAKLVYNDSDATMDQIVKAWLNLANSMHYLDFKADKTALHALIEKYKDLNTDDYTTGVEEFKAALEEAILVAEDEDALQARIDAASGRLIAAVAGLDSQDVDKTALNLLIGCADEAIKNAVLYDQGETWSNFMSAYDEAVSIADNASATQSEINVAVANLASAYENIRLLPNEELLGKLKAFIETANTLNQEDYSADNYAFVMQVRNESDVLLNSDSLTQNEILDIYAQIDKAYAIIKNEKLQQSENPSDIQNPSESEDVQQPTENQPTVNTPTEDVKSVHKVNGTTKPSTGDATAVNTVVITTLAAGVCVLMLRKRKN